jgi:hemin uptake protein HemP
MPSLTSTRVTSTSIAAHGSKQTFSSAAAASSKAAAQTSEAAQREAKETIASDALLGKQGMCVIMHNAERYLLRRTRNGKLILTK